MKTSLIALMLTGAVAAGQLAETHDLAVAGVVGPRVVILSAERPTVTKPVVVIVQNRGERRETIADADALAQFVSLDVKSLGALVDREAVLVAPPKFPLVLRPGRKLAVVFAVTFDGANDPERSTRTVKHDDFRYVATIQPDANPANDSARSHADTDVILAPSFTHEAAAREAAAARLGASSSELSSSRERSARNAVGGAVFERLTAKPMVVPIKKGKTVSEPIVFTAVYTGASPGLSWGPGDAVPPFVYAGNTFKCQWNTGGDHTVTAYIFDGSPNPPHKSLTIQVVKVNLQDENAADPDGMIVGITTARKDRSRTLKAIVEPAAKAGEVQIRIGKGGSNLQVKGTPAVDTGAGTVTFRVEGTGTAGSKMTGDCSVEAVVGGIVAASANVTVVVPRFIERQVIVGTNDHNFLAYRSDGRHAGSSPSISDAPVYPIARRMTFYGFLVEVEVSDQFHNRIDDAKTYLDADISEDFGGGRIAGISQKIRNGSVYSDPAGFLGQDWNPGRPDVLIGSPQATAFLGAPPLFPYPPKLRNLPALAEAELPVVDFFARVDGFLIQPRIHRRVTVSSNGTVKLEQTP